MRITQQPVSLEKPAARRTTGAWPTSRGRLGRQRRRARLRGAAARGTDGACWRHCRDASATVIGMRYGLVGGSRTHTRGGRRAVQTSTRERRAPAREPTSRAADTATTRSTCARRPTIRAVRAARACASEIPKTDGPRRGVPSGQGDALVNAWLCIRRFEILPRHVVPARSPRPTRDSVRGDAGRLLRTVVETSGVSGVKDRLGQHVRR